MGCVSSSEHESTQEDIQRLKVIEESLIAMGLAIRADIAQSAAYYSAKINSNTDARKY